MSNDHPLSPLDADGALVIAQLPSSPTVSENGAAQGPAQATTGENGAPGAAGAAAPPPGFGDNILFLLLGFMLLMILMSVFSGRKEKKRRQEMLSSVRRHDQVMMTGGIIGTITDVRDDRVIVKVDDSTNTRIQFSKNSVQSVLKTSGSPDTPEPEQEPEPELLDDESR